METADEIVVLWEGELQQVGTPEEIFESGVLNRVMGIALSRTRTEEGWRYFCGLP
jgi:iron complex transport system ATP-binding protein